MNFAIVDELLEKNTDNLKLPCHGVILFRRNFTQTLLVSTERGHRSFPKGKRNSGESGLECAFREFIEETGIPTDKINILTNTTTTELEHNLDSTSMAAVWLIENSKRGNPTIGLLIGVIDDSYDKPFVFDPDELALVEWVDCDKALKMPDEHFHKKRRIVLEEAIGLIKDM